MRIAAIRMLVVPGAEAEAHLGNSAIERAALIVEFPTVAFLTERGASGFTDEPVTVELAPWLDTRVDFAPFDAAVDELVARGPACIVVRGDARELTRAAWEMLGRWQRHLDRRNEASRAPGFDALLLRLRAAHDRSKPRVRAEWNHALDTWQWMLRLDPEASAEAQIAALLHDVERLESETDARAAKLASDYDGFKAEHARRGADIARTILKASGIDGVTQDRVAELVATHERSTGDPECSLLNDADALSFFSQKSSGYLDSFGSAQTAREIAYSLSRMRSGAVARLARVRLRADVEALVAKVRSGAAAS